MIKEFYDIRWQRTKNNISNYNNIFRECILKGNSRLIVDVVSCRSFFSSSLIKINSSIRNRILSKIAQVSRHWCFDDTPPMPKLDRRRKKKCTLNYEKYRIYTSRRLLGSSFIHSQSLLCATWDNGRFQSLHSSNSWLFQPTRPSRA